MAQEGTIQGRLGSLLRLLATLELNRQELQHLEPSIARFVVLLTQAQEAADRQATHTAAKQEASQQFQTLLGEGERMATVLRLGVKQHFGIRAEKLTEFGLKPFRRRVRKAPETPQPPAPVPPPVEGELKAGAGATATKS